MTKYLLYSDAESSILRNEKNYRNLKPENFDNNKKFTLLFSNIFELIMMKNTASVEKL